MAEDEAEVVVVLTLEPVNADWARPHLRRSLEHALAPERAAEYGGRSSGWGGLVGAVLLLGAVLLGPRVALASRSGDWFHLVVPVAGISVAMLIVGAVWRRLKRRPLYDLALVQEKLSRPAARVELRLVVFAPADAQPQAVTGRLQDLAAVHRTYDLDRGNRLVARRVVVPPGAYALCAPTPLGGTSRLVTLGTRELAALWHPVQAADDVALVERTTARRFLPLPTTVADGARLGVSEDGLGRRVEVHLAPALLRRHALLVAKTRKGKSGPLRNLWQQLIAVDTDSTAGGRFDRSAQ
jgi:hypothetical protein